MLDESLGTCGRFSAARARPADRQERVRKDSGRRARLGPYGAARGSGAARRSTKDDRRKPRTSPRAILTCQKHKLTRTSGRFGTEGVLSKHMRATNRGRKALYEYDSLGMVRAALVSSSRLSQSRAIWQWS